MRNKFQLSISKGKWLIVPGILLPFLLLIWFFICLPQQLFDKPTSTILLDKNHQLLSAVIAQDGQWRFPHNDLVPEKFAISIIQFEDKNFKSHNGVYLPSILRALIQNIEARRIVSGGSTISMQVVRMSRDNPGRTIWEKMTEVFRALRLESQYSKDEILAFYASNAPMGGNVVGLDGAAWRYFGRSPEDLSWAETAMLAVLPNAPSLLFPGKNDGALKAKRDRLLNQLTQEGFISQSTFKSAILEPIPDKPEQLPQSAQHLLDFASRCGLANQRIHTSINFDIQRETTQLLELHSRKLAGNQIHNAAALIINNESREVVAYVGNSSHSPGKYGSNVDVIQAPRSTGSILKPLLYAFMLNDGEIMPHSLVPDVPTNFGGYSPKNYTRTHDGAVPAAQALSRSLNIPSVLMMKEYGGGRFLRKLHRMKFKHFPYSSEHYGLSLILGGGETSLWEITSAYSNMAATLMDYKKYNGQYRYDGFQAPEVFEQIPSSETFTTNPVLNAASIYQTFEALCEVNRPSNESGWKFFNSSEKIAWKTGTSFGYRDAWAVGTNGKYTVGIWVGNADGMGRPGIVGVEAAAPLLFKVFDNLPSNSWFMQPYDEMAEVSVCAQSGHRVGPSCNHGVLRWVPISCLNTLPCPYHQKVHLDAATNERSNQNCSDSLISKNWFVLPAVQEWYYVRKNPDYKYLPEWKNGCMSDDVTNPITLLYPTTSTRIFVPTNLDTQKSRVILRASHRQAGKKIFWHLNETYLGETQEIHHMEIAPPAGKYILTLTDEDGMIFSRVIEILQSDAKEGTKK